MAAIIPICRKLLSKVGVDVQNYFKSPSYTYLGLKDEPIDAVIDIGANAGQFAKRIIKVFPDASIYCFEPLPEPFEKLDSWAAGKKVKTFNMALGNKKDKMEMNLHTDHSLSSSLLETTETTSELYPVTSNQQKIEIEVERLDDIAETTDLYRFKNILVKMDVQGFENRVIEGARKFLPRSSAVILEVSLDNLYDQQADFRELTGMLYDLGFSYAGNLSQVFGQDGHCIYLDAVFKYKV